MRLMMLMENTALCDSYASEHGLSLYLETETHNILFDMGQTTQFSENAKRMGVDLDRVDFAVLSHGHYDHGGGLAHFLSCNERAPVYLSTHAFEPHYNKSGKYNGLDPRLSGHSRLIPIADSLLIDENAEIHACLRHPLVAEVATDGLQACDMQDGRLCAEDFRHEIYLLLHDRGRRILISGCAHRGVRNLLAWFQPDILIGGFHMMNLDFERECDRRTLEESTEVLLREPTRYYTGHCTGLRQYAFLKERLGERLSYLSAGTCFEI